MKLFVLFTLKSAARDTRLNTQIEWSSPPRDLTDIRQMEASIALDEGVDPGQITIERADQFPGAARSEW